MRIAYVLDAWPRLTETFVVRELAYVAARHDVRILALERGDAAPASEEAARLDPRVEVLAARGGVGAWAATAGRLCVRPARGARALAAARRGRAESALRRLPALVGVAAGLSRWGVERIHAHFARWATAAAEVLGAATGAPWGFTAHAYDLFVAPARLDDKVRRASWAVTCTDAGRAEIARRCGEAVAARVHVIRHGLDLGAPRPRDGARAPGPLRLLAVGRLVEKKGFGDLLDAVALLAGRGVAVEVRVIGDGPLAAALDERARGLGIGGALGVVRRLGSVPPAEVLDAMGSWADVLVAPSVVTGDGDRDGIPNVVGEALAAGVPVVGTTVGGIPELVVDGHSGLLVPPHDAAALADALARLAGDAALRARLGEGAVAIARARFDAATNLGAFLRLLERAGADG